MGGKKGRFKGRENDGKEDRVKGLRLVTARGLRMGEGLRVAKRGRVKAGDRVKGGNKGVGLKVGKSDNGLKGRRVKVVKRGRDQGEKNEEL